MIQYAILFPSGYTIFNTFNLTDEEILKRATSPNFKIERYNRCIACETWTTINGKLDTSLNCPAIKEFLKSREI